MVEGGISGQFWYCDGIFMRQVAHVPPDCVLFKMFSVYHHEGIIWAAKGDAIARKIGDGDDDTQDEVTDDEEAPGGEDEGWHRLSFDHDDEQTYSSHITNAGQNTRLRTQRPDQTWPKMLLPESYHAPEASRTSAQYTQYGGLTGELPLFLALIAFSVPPAHVEWVFKNCFQSAIWRAHSGDHIREDGRGMVVRVYSLPGRTEELEYYENGAWGKYFN